MRSASPNRLELTISLSGLPHGFDRVGRCLVVGMSSVGIVFSGFFSFHVMGIGCPLEGDPSVL